MLDVRCAMTSPLTSPVDGFNTLIGVQRTKEHKTKTKKTPGISNRMGQPAKETDGTTKQCTTI